jgi:hypothetical protein
MFARPNAKLTKLKKIYAERHLKSDEGITVRIKYFRRYKSSCLLAKALSLSHT